MNTYLYKHQIFRLSKPLSKGSYHISTNEEEQWKYYVEITEERAKELEEEWNRPIPPAPEPYIAPEEKRREAYKQEADDLLVAYYGYLAEGKKDKAEEQLQLYIAKKEEIRQRFPDEVKPINEV